MTEPQKSDKLMAMAGDFVLCPYCGHKLKHIAWDEEAERIKIRCSARECKHDVYFSIHKGRCFESRGH